MSLKPDNIDLFDPKCKKTPSQIQEYIDIAKVENTTPDQYVWEEEGTLNRENGHFLCTSCYIAVGQPSSSRGWICP